MLRCLKSASISMLVNRNPTKEFYPQRGLKQGDPLSPLLFNIVVEGLSGLMSKAINRGLYRGFLVGTNKVEVSLLQYADDTIFLGEATMENVRAIKAILCAFELASGLKINFAKSSCGTFGASDQWTYDASNYLNCRLMFVPFTYLGIHIGANPRRCQTWDPLTTKCERKLARWKQRHLSFGERVTLINLVLTSIPIYFLSFFRIPKQVVNKIVRLQRNFLWGGTSDQIKIPWIRWETVCLPKEQGGLGVKDITSFNISLLGKWKWDLLQNQGETWTRVLEAKYGGWIWG